MKNKKTKISPKVLAFMILEANTTNNFSVFFQPSAERKSHEILSKTTERMGQQKKHLIDSAKVVASQFAATSSKPDKLNLIKRLDNDYSDFIGCYDASPNFVINMRF